MAAIQILLETLPIQATIGQRQFCSIPSFLQNYTILEAIVTQLAPMSQHSHSCIINTQKLITKYQLPKFLDIIKCVFSKEEWKENVKKAIF